MGRLTKRHGKHAVQIGGETRRNDIGWLALADYEDLEEQGRLIDGDKLIMSIADWQMTLSPANNEADVFEYNVLESVIEHIAELKELEGAKESGWHNTETANTVKEETDGRAD